MTHLNARGDTCDQNRKMISEYLYYGYLIDNTTIESLDSCFDALPADASHTPKDAGRLLDSVVDELLYRIPNNGYCIVPISGGWDSRILMGAVLERFNSNQIKTLSYGVPGQLDFDLGVNVAKTLELEHHAVDLSKVNLSWDNLLNSIKESPWTYVPDGFFNRHSIRTMASENDVVISGFMGDVVTGGHYSNHKSEKEAAAKFIKQQRRAKKRSLYPAAYRPQSAIPLFPSFSRITPSELLDIGIRQTCCISSIVTPQTRWSGWAGKMGYLTDGGTEVLAPFAHPAWAAYWLGAPDEAKKEQILYTEMMRVKFPKLATLPSKYSYGASKLNGVEYNFKKNTYRVKNKAASTWPHIFRPPSEMLNYINYQEAFRSRDDYQCMLEKAMSYISEKHIAPWIDLDKLKIQHMVKRANLSEEFLVLIGLALNLINEEMQVLT